MSRCYCKTSHDYAHYGAIGITACKEWHNAAVFVAWCENQPNTSGRVLLDRRDNKLGYSSDNCRLVSDSVSVRNRRMSIWVDINSERLVLKDAVSKYGQVSYSCAKVRVRELGWNPLDAVIVPAHSALMEDK